MTGQTDINLNLNNNNKNNNNNNYYYSCYYYCYINSTHVECESIRDTCNKRVNWNHLKISQYLSNIPGKQEIKELQKKKKTSHTAQILRKALA